MLTIKELRSHRVAAEIPATLLAAKAGINRSRLSILEHGYSQATEDEMRKLCAAFEQLLHAKAVIRKAEASVGWPMAAVGQ